MKEYTLNMLNENSLWNDQATKDKYLKQKAKLNNGFWLNFFGIFGLFAKFKNDPKLLSYLKKSSSRIEKITDNDIDFMIIMKLISDKDLMFSTNINKITKLLAKIKMGTITSLDENMFRDDIVKKIKITKLGPQKEVGDLMRSFKKGDKTLSELLPDIYSVSKLKNQAGEFRELYKKLKDKKVDDVKDSSVTNDPIKSALTGVPLIATPEDKKDVVQVDATVTWKDVQHYLMKVNLNDKETFTLFMHYMLFGDEKISSKWINNVSESFNVTFKDLENISLTSLDYFFSDNYTSLYDKYPEAQKLINPINGDFSKIPEEFFSEIFNEKKNWYVNIMRCNLISSDIQLKDLFALAFKFSEYPEYIGKKFSIYESVKNKLKSILLKNFILDSSNFISSLYSASVTAFLDNDDIIDFLKIIFGNKDIDPFSYFTEQTYQVIKEETLLFFLDFGVAKDLTPIYKQWYKDFSDPKYSNFSAFKLADKFLTAQEKIDVMGGVKIPLLADILVNEKINKFIEIFGNVPYKEFIDNQKISEDELATYISTYPNSDFISSLINFSTRLYNPKKYQITNTISYDISSLVLKVLEKITKNVVFNLTKTFGNRIEILFNYCEKLKRYDLMNKFILFFMYETNFDIQRVNMYVLQKYIGISELEENCIKVFLNINPKLRRYEMEKMFNDTTILTYAKDIVDKIPNDETSLRYFDAFNCNIYGNSYYKALFDKYFKLKFLPYINKETKKHITHLMSRDLENKFAVLKTGRDDLIGNIYGYIVELVDAGGITKDEAVKLCKDNFGSFDDYIDDIIELEYFRYNEVHLKEKSFEIFVDLFDDSETAITELMESTKFKLIKYRFEGVEQVSSLLSKISPYIQTLYEKFGTDIIISFFDKMNKSEVWDGISSGKRLLSKSSEFGDILLDVITNTDKRKDIDKILNSLPEKIQKGFISAIKEQMVMIPLLHDLQLSDNPLKPKIHLDSERIKKLLKYNNFKISMKGLGKKKKETFEEYFTRLETSKDLTSQIPDIKLEKIEETQDQLNEKTVEFSKYYNGKHGDSAVEFLESYNVNMEYPEWKEFENRFGSNMLIPAFHGSGLVASNFILRFGFTVIPANDGSTTGRMLDIGNMTLVKPVSAGDELNSGNDYVAYLEDGYFPIDSSQSDRNVDWDEYIDTSKYYLKKINTVGGVYVSDIIEKTAQYLGDDGFSRRYGTIGVIYEMEANLGDKGLHYYSAGTGGDGIKSPEYSVCWPKGQLRIKRAHKVKFSSKKYVNKLKKQYPHVLKENKYFSNFAEYLKEEKVMKNKNSVSYVFLDGYIPNGKNKFVDWKTFEKKIIKNSTKMRLESDQRGTHLVFETKKDIHGVYVIPDTTEFISEDPEGLYSRFQMLLNECK